MHRRCLNLRQLQPRSFISIRYRIKTNPILSRGVNEKSDSPTKWRGVRAGGQRWLLGILLLLMLIISFSVQVHAGQVRMSEEASINMMDRANLAVYLLEQSIVNPSWYYTDAVCGITPVQDHAAVRVGLARVATRLSHVRSSVSSTAPSESSALFCESSLRADENGAIAALQVTDQPSDSTVLTVRLRFEGSVVVFDNLPEVLAQIEAQSTQYTLAISRQTGVEIGTAQGIAATPPPNSPHMFIPAVIRDNYRTFNGAVSEAEFGHDVLSGPTGACAVKCVHDVFTTDYDWDVLLIADGNWNRILYSGVSPNSDPFITTTGSYGTGNMQFRRPIAVDVSVNYVYFVDRYNQRLMICTYNGTDGGLIHRESVLGFTAPVDVTTSMIPDLPATDTQFTYRLAVLDQEPGRIYVYGHERGESPIQLRVYQPTDFGSLPLNTPTALCFGRHMVTSHQSNQLYVVDNGNKRVVCRSEATGSLLQTTPGTFPENAFLTSIDTDPFGWIYVTDAQAGCVYLLSPDLKKVVATYGTKGTGPGQLWYPQSIARQFGWKDSVYSDGRVHTRSLGTGDVVVCEPFGTSTGIKRFVMGQDLLSKSCEYFPGVGCNWNSDGIRVSWHQTGPAWITVKFFNTAMYNPEYPRYEVSRQLFMPGYHTVVYRQRQIDLYSEETQSVTVTLESEGLYRPSDNEEPHSTFDELVTQPFQRLAGECGPIEDPTRKRITINGLEIIDPSTHLPVSSVYGYPLKSWLVRLDVTDNCPEANRPLRYYWSNLLDQSDNVIESTYFSGSAQSNEASAFTYVTTDPWVYATFRFKKNPGVIVAESLATVKIAMLHPDSSEHPVGYCELHSNVPAAASPQEIDYDVVGVVYPYTCTGPGGTCPSGGGPPPGGGGCPFLYVQDSTGWRFINNILPQSEISRDSTLLSADLCLLPIRVPATGGPVNVRLTEEEQEISAFDLAQLVSLTFPSRHGFPRLTTRGDLVDADGPLVRPFLATTHDGRDITDLLAWGDGQVYRADGAEGFIDFQYDLTRLGPRQQAVGSNTSASGGVEPPPPPKGSVSKLSTTQATSNSVYLQVQLPDGAFADVDRIAPRKRRTEQMVDLSAYMGTSPLKIRLAWTGAIELDELPFRQFSRPQVSVSRLSAVSAMHSRLGESRQRLRTRDGDLVGLRPGETIDMNFSLPPVADTLKRIIAVAVVGRYAKQGSAAGSLVLPDQFSFEQNFPNPFNPSTTFRFSLPAKATVKLEVFNVVGQKIATLVNREYEGGEYVYNWNGQVNGEALASGIYLARLTAGGHAATRKMVVLK